MSQTSELIESLKDGDMILVFRMPEGAVRRRAFRSSWATLRKTLSDSFGIEEIKAEIQTVAKQTGPPGRDGIDGQPGRDGAQGVAGAAGATGTAGAAGAQGPAGAAGKDGAAGAKGDTGPIGPAGPTGATGAQGPTGAMGPAGKTGADGIPKRVERYIGTVVGSAGIATITFPDFTAPPIGDVVTTWDNAQMITGTVTATTKNSATVKVMKSVATVLLNASPFALAPAGTVVTVSVIGT